MSHPSSTASPTARWESDPLLEVVDLTMRFGGLTAVDNLSFTAGRGDRKSVV